MTESICEKFGITPSEVERRLWIFNITPDDECSMSRVRNVISANADLLTNAFYKHILQFEELSRFISSRQRMKQLQQALVRHLMMLGENVFQTDYFEGRLRVGMMHERAGILPKWYVGAYAQLRALLNQLVLDRRMQVEEPEAALVSLNKFICLDVELALETYYCSAMARVELLMQQLESRQDEIRKLAQTDQLTGLPNRRHFLEYLETEVHRSQRHNRPLCLMLLDVDDFKSVNDRFGHPAGDLVLRTVGRLLPQLVRSTDFCGRIGGEELGVVLVESDLTTANLIAERVRLGILQNEIDDQGRRFFVTVSIGIAPLTEGTGDISSLLREADMAMYEAKGDGKNCVRSSGLASTAQPA